MTGLETHRLILRSPVLSDAAAITLQIGDWDVASKLGSAPYPYTDDHARSFILHAEEDRARGTSHVFAATLRDDGQLIGMCGLHLKDGLFEIGYWLGRSHWGRGYATEMAGRVLAFAFEELRCERLTAGWFHDNPASGHVLAKLGGYVVGTAPRNCLARGEAVSCHNVILEAAAFSRSIAA